jgi:hypothetical protein
MRALRHKAGPLHLAAIVLTHFCLHEPDRVAIALDASQGRRPPAWP